MGGFRDAGNQRILNRRLGEVLGGAGVSTMGNTAGGTGTVLGPVVLVGLQGVSLSQSTKGNQATISIIASVEAGVAVGAGTVTANTGTVVFSNSNNVTFGMAGSTVTASAGGGVMAFGVSTGGATLGTTGTQTGTFVLQGLPLLTAEPNLQLSQVTGGAGQHTINIVVNAVRVGAQGTLARTQPNGLLNFQNSNGLTFGLSQGAEVGTMTASVSREPSLAAGTQTGSSGTIIFSNSNGVSFGMAGNQTVTASVGLGLVIEDSTGTINAPGLGALIFSNFGPGGGAVSFHTTSDAGGSVVVYGDVRTFVSLQVNNGFDRGVFIGGISTGTLHLAPWHFQNAINATRADIIFDVSNSSSAGATVTMLLGLYSLSGSTIGTLWTASRTWGYNSTAAQSSYTQVSGTRYRSMSLGGGTWFVTPGEYVLGAMFSLSTSGTAGTHRPMGGRDVSVVGAEYPLALGTAVPYWNGGIYSATTGALPATIQLSQMVVTGADDILFVPFVTLAGTF